jgi:hypothetical protein
VLGLKCITPLLHHSSAPALVHHLAADSRYRDVRHRRIRFRAMPMALARLDVDDVADGYLALLPFCRDHAFTRCHHQDLIAIVGVPSGGGAFAEVHHVTTEVLGLSVADDRLPRPADRSTGPSGNGVAVSIGFSGKS